VAVTGGSHAEKVISTEATQRWRSTEKIACWCHHPSNADIPVRGFLPNQRNDVVQGGL
jgi:hypothetical protein